MAEGSARTSTSSAKRALRSRLLAAREELAPSERARIDERIAGLVVASDAFRRASTVFTYLSFGAEVETRVIIRASWAADKVVALPRVAGPRELRWYRVDSFEGLVRSAHGMLEPAADARFAIDPPLRVQAREGRRARRHAVQVCAEGAAATACANGAACGNCAACALALVPGIAFDRRGFRLGYGGGYYDAFLSAFAGTSLGLCRSSSLFGSLGALGAREPHDVPVSVVVTEHVYRVVS